MTCSGATPRSHLHALTAWAGPRPGDRIEHLALVPPELIPELAPFGPLDPWAVIAAATTRRTASGEVAGLGERITFAQALDAYLAPPGDPGGPPRRVSPGLPADLVVLHAPLAQAARLPDPVRAVLVNGTTLPHPVGPPRPISTARRPARPRSL